ncbi:sulfotransferase domain-containing protein [Pelagibius sp.]|uniref:sulfotransferase domain-containing protein n=1 Tax=Pelagibius sp. TaxID=1931238 RepID=UPI003B513D95
MAPDFIIIGAMKCGTTSLYRYLGAHPEIGLSREKETDFFLAKQNFAQGLDWYRAQFTSGARIHGEASPNYTKHSEFPGVPERIFSTAPGVKLIYIVRDPIDRFLSQYHHHAIAGEANQDPAQVLNSQAGRNYLECSRYFKQLSRYLEFFERDRIFIACFDELRDRPQALLRQVFDFLEVDSAITVDGLDRIHNQRSSLQGLPQWYFNARRSPVLRAIKARIPRPLYDAMLNQLRRRSQVELPRLDEGLRAELKDLLQDDATQFRDLAGMPFNNWSL